MGYDEDEEDQTTQRKNRQPTSNRIVNKKLLLQLFEDEDFKEYYGTEVFHEDEVALFIAASSDIEPQFITYSPMVWTCSYWDSKYTNRHEVILQTVIDRQDPRWNNADFDYDEACMTMLGSCQSFENTVLAFKNYIDDILALQDCWNQDCKSMIPYMDKLRKIRKRHGGDLMTMAVCAGELVRRIRLHNYRVNNKRFTLLNTSCAYNQSNQRLIHGIIHMVRSWLYTFALSSAKVKALYRKSADIKLHDYIANDMSQVMRYRGRGCESHLGFGRRCLLPVFCVFVKLPMYG